MVEDGCNLNSYINVILIILLNYCKLINKSNNQN
jgi:hypothetical protein